MFWAYTLLLRHSYDLKRNIRLLLDSFECLLFSVLKTVLFGFVLCVL